MDDFLYNLRTGKDRHFDRGRRQYNGNQHRSGDKRSGKDYRKGSYEAGLVLDKLTALADEAIPAIKTLLENIDKNNQRLADNEALLVKAEERKAKALENIAQYLQSVHGPIDPLPENESPVKMATADRQDVLELIDEMRAQGLSFDNIACKLEEKGIQTFSGKGQWRGQTVHRLFKQSSSA